MTEPHIDEKGKVKKHSELSPNERIRMAEKLIDKRFLSPNLLKETLKEVSKDHIADDKEKISLFCLALTCKLEPNRRRKSIAILGDSSVGKDNLMDSIIKHIPNSIKLTSATQSVMEDDIEQYDLVGFSELNVREGGANVHLIEVLKQMTEGGTSSMKKDASKGFKVAKKTKQEQKTVLFSTTQERRDEELETRFICMTVQSSDKKIKLVNRNTAKDFASLDIIKPMEESWILKGINLLPFNKVIIPYAEILVDVFDNSNPRSQRDVKRFFSLVAAISYYNQMNRYYIIDGCEGVVVANKVDCINAFKMAKGFFNLSYKGIDIRVKQVLEVMKDYIQKNPMVEPIGYTPRKHIQNELGVSLNTIKSRVRVLLNSGLVEWNGDKYNPCYKLTYQKGVKNLLIRCQLNELIKKLEEYNLTNSDIFDRLLTGSRQVVDTIKNAEILEFKGLRENEEKVSNNLSNTLSNDRNDENQVFSENLTGSKLTPLKIEEEVIEK